MSNMLLDYNNKNNNHLIYETEAYESKIISNLESFLTCTTPCFDNKDD